MLTSTAWDPDKGYLGVGEEKPLLDNLESMALITNFLTLYLGMLFHTNHEIFSSVAGSDTVLSMFLVGLLALPAVGCISVKRQERAQARVDLGVAYLREGTSELAIATLMEATELDPRNIDAWDRLGLALILWEP
jgi:tetratricopeptide (TPR) repeat protein